MTKLRLGRLVPAAAGILAAAAVTAMALLAPAPLTERVLDPTLDLVLASFPAAPDPRVVVVDIDRDALARLGPWPWPRERLAALVAGIAAAKPSVLAVDILLSEPDRRAPATLARDLAAATGRADLATLAAELPDPDRELAEALGRTPAVLGFLVTPEPQDAAPAAPPIVAARGARLGDLPEAPGLEAPLPRFVEAAAGIGVQSLFGSERDGVVRTVPLLVRAGGKVYPMLAAEALRVAAGARSFLVTGEPTGLSIGGSRAAVLPDGGMVLRMSAPTGWPAATVPALDVVDGRAGERLAGRIVFLGSSAPELGGLRPTAVAPLTPSMRIQADSAAEILSGRAPVRPDGKEGFEAAAAALLSLAAIVAALMLTPAIGAVVAVALSGGWVAFAVHAVVARDTLTDPLLPALAPLAGFAAASLAGYAETRRREARLRRRFEQYLAPDIIRRIVETPSLVRVEGEMRDVTALFTDVEGFTSMTERIEPRLLVRLLDRYFEGITQIVVTHRGMVDKIVGDAVHALFNAPLDQPDHPRQALACARAIADFAEAFRNTPEASGAGFGRTRIGLETGPAIVGDVGGSRKLDYTAHGTIVNTAARLEAANKDFASTIAAGARLAAACPDARWRPLGKIVLRGLAEPMLVREPWPEDASEDDRAAYQAAFDLTEEDPLAAREAFAALAVRRPGDAVVARWLERLIPKAGDANASGL